MENSQENGVDGKQVAAEGQFECRLLIPSKMAGSIIGIREDCVIININFEITNVPDPADPYVFGHSGSGSISQRYGSRSGSFYHQAKIARITLIPIVL
jgi:hypothetical protein